MSSRVRVCAANHLERLLDSLHESLAGRDRAPLQVDTVVVQSHALRRYVQLGIARRSGIAAGLALPTPADLLRTLADDLVGPLAPQFGRDALGWRIHALLPRLGNDERFAPLRRYVDDGEPRKRRRLASRIAQQFDDLQWFRPDWLVAVEGTPLGTTPPMAGNATAAFTTHGPWLADLWRLVVADIDAEIDAEPSHRRLARLHTTLTTNPSPTLDASLSTALGGLHLFALSTLAPIVLDLLLAIADRLPDGATLYLLQQNVHIGERRNEVHHELTRASSRQSDAFQSLLLARDLDVGPLEDDAIVDPGEATALRVLQRDLLFDVARGNDAAPVALAATDRSLRVHVAHGPLREVEVLREQLLDAFAADPTLRPDDVAVLLTDVATYAPFVTAVFGGDAEPRLPWQLADRTLAQEQPLVAAFLAVVDLLRARVTADELLDLLQHEPIRRRFGIRDVDVPALHEWAHATGVTFGVDANDRATRLRLPSSTPGTWRAALDRLLAGFATGPVDARVTGLRVHAEATTGRGELLGRFATFAEAVFEQIASLQTPRTPDRWRADLTRALDLTIAEDPERDADAGVDLRRRLASLFAGAPDTDVELAAVSDAVADGLSADGFGTAFFTGRITFCAWKPLRTIPFRVLAVVGLDDGRFPRAATTPGFDFVTAAPRLGDRDVRADDRQSFLELLAAAGDRLVLTCSGRSPRDDTPRAPSVVVAELLDSIDRTFVPPRNVARARDVVVVTHPLQPFAAVNFAGDPERFSFATEGAHAASIAAAARTPPMPFVTTHARAVAPTSITADDFVTFFQSPARAFCRDVLRLQFARDDAEFDDERFTLDGLTAYHLRERMARTRANAGASPPELELADLHDLSLVPPEGLGGAYRDLESHAVGVYVERVRSHASPGQTPIDVTVDGLRITGVLAGPPRFEARPGKYLGKHRIAAWLRHLLWQAHVGPSPTELIGIDTVTTLAPVADAIAALRPFVAAFREGHTTPLPFFPRASDACAESHAKKGDDAAALRAAGVAYHGGASRRPGGPPPDGEDPFHALCFRGRDPIADPAFVRLAHDLLGPLHAHLDGGDA